MLKLFVPTLTCLQLAQTLVPGKFLSFEGFPPAARLCASSQNAFLWDIRKLGNYRALGWELGALDEQLAVATTCCASCEERFWEAFASWEHRCNILGSQEKKGCFFFPLMWKPFHREKLKIMIVYWDNQFCTLFFNSTLWLFLAELLASIFST